MKREAFNHPKMLDLAARLEISEPHAFGVVATMLNWAADMAPQGNIGKWTDQVIARACRWPGDATEFVGALVDSGWLDRCSAHRLVIHDLEDHAERWWDMKLKKLGLPFLKAQPIESNSTEQSNESSTERSIEQSANVASDPAEGSILLCSALQTSALQTSLIPATTPKAKPLTIDDLSIPESLNDDVGRQAINDWLAYKRRKKQSYKEAKFLNAMLKDFEADGSSALAEAVKRCAGSNYDGLFKKGNHNGNRNSGARTGYDPNQRGDF